MKDTPASEEQAPYFNWEQGGGRKPFGRYDYNKSFEIMGKYVIAVLLVLSSCNSKQTHVRTDKEIRPDMCFDYPSVVDSLHCEDIYDSARWFIYTWQCDVKYTPGRGAAKDAILGELPLAFERADVSGDTVLLKFNFMDGRQYVLSSMTATKFELCTGVGFNRDSKEKLYMWSPNGFTTTIKGGANRFENPLQPDVVSYIQDN